MDKKLFIRVLKQEGRDYCKILISSVGDVEDIVFECVMGEDLRHAAMKAVVLWAKYFHDYDAVLRVGSEKIKVKG